jgi:hypothetical protein
MSHLNERDFKDRDIERQERIDHIRKGLYGDIEKGGEGSRGGRVIGHTVSGKAVYEKKSAKSYKNFSVKDHKEASNIHDSYIDKIRGSQDNKSERWASHRNLRDEHITIASEIGTGGDEKNDDENDTAKDLTTLHRESARKESFNENKRRSDLSQFESWQEALKNAKTDHERDVAQKWVDHLTNRNIK